MSDTPEYPIIELARTGERIMRWRALIRFGPDVGEWCCISLAITKTGAEKSVRWKWKERQKPYVEPTVVERVPL